jgi:predicted nucleic acid-binding Zn ribbon protein
MDQASEAGRYLRSLPRTPKQKTCLVCGKAFETTGRGKYCSARCRWDAFQQKRAAEAARLGLAAPAGEDERGQA